MQRTKAFEGQLRTFASDFARRIPATPPTRNIPVCDAHGGSDDSDSTSESGIWYVCVFERERKREREGKVWIVDEKRESVCDKERECVCMCVCVCVEEKREREEERERRKQRKKRSSFLLYHVSLFFFC
jgi:hypothetical protein